MTATVAAAATTGLVHFLAIFRLIIGKPDFCRDFPLRKSIHKHIFSILMAQTHDGGLKIGVRERHISFGFQDAFLLPGHQILPFPILEPRLKLPIKKQRIIGFT